MALSVKLEAFEGPLDLLLHLIEKNKVDIYDIPIAMITDQYMEYIEAMKQEDLGIMSEFLVMAATLLDIKCKMLLPKEVDEEGEEIDPRAEMVQQLLEYKMYKYMSYELRDMKMAAGDSVTRKASIPEEVEKYRPPIDYEELVGDMTLSALNDIFKDIMKRQVDKIDPIRSKFGAIEKDPVNIEEKTAWIDAYAAVNKKFSFRNLLQSQASKLEIVVTFLVVLEYMKMGRFTVNQNGLFQDIEIEYHEEVDAPSTEELLKEISPN